MCAFHLAKSWLLSFAFGSFAHFSLTWSCQRYRSRALLSSEHSERTDIFCFSDCASFWRLVQTSRAFASPCSLPRTIFHFVRVECTRDLP